MKVAVYDDGNYWVDKNQHRIFVVASGALHETFAQGIPVAHDDFSTREDSAAFHDYYYDWDWGTHAVRARRSRRMGHGVTFMPNEYT
eukprot:3264574-Karenia_brevis.AAC.1